MIKFILTLALALSLSANAQAKSKIKKTQTKAPNAKTINLDQQFNNLGNNEEIMKKAQALQPNNTMSIVQKREVDRNLRLEVGGSYGFVNGGDSYIDTRNLGANLDFHINPRWSLGARYVDNRSQLTGQGKRVFDAAAAAEAAGQPYTAVGVDYPERSYMAVINWYPIYGKVSWFESAVSQFDFYLIAGAGQIELSRSKSPIYTAGAGMGLWINSWLTSRIEVRYQNYKDKPLNEERNIDGLVLQLGFGFML